MVAQMVEFHTKVWQHISIDNESEQLYFVIAAVHAFIRRKMSNDYVHSFKKIDKSAESLLTTAKSTLLSSLK